MQISLLDSEPCQPQFKGSEPLRQSLIGLKDKFHGVLAAEGFSAQDLSVATLHFVPDPAQQDDHCCICHATLKTKDGEPVECVVNYLGQKQDAQPALQADAAAQRGLS